MRVSIRAVGLAALVFAGLAWMAGGSVRGSDEIIIDKSFIVKAGGKLILDTDIGSIDVRGAEGGAADVKVFREARSEREENALKDFKIDIDQKGNDIHVRGEYSRHGFRSFWDQIWKKLKVRFVITVPHSYNADLKTSGGSISVVDLTGYVTSKTSGGSLFFKHISGDVNGRTSGGSIQATSVDGRINVHTSGGGIRLEETRGDILARTSGGGIAISKASGEVNVHTSGGSIKAEDIEGAVVAGTSGGSVSVSISGQPKSRCELKTSGGSITVYLAGDAAVDIDAHTTGGSVSTEFPVTVQGKMHRNSLQAQLNGGGPELTLRTSGGSIRINKR